MENVKNTVTAEQEKKTTVSDRDRRIMKDIVKLLEDFASGFDSRMHFMVTTDPDGFSHMQIVEVEEKTYRQYNHMSMDKSYADGFTNWTDNTDYANSSLLKSGELIEDRKHLVEVPDDDGEEIAET